MRFTAVAQLAGDGSAHAVIAESTPLTWPPADGDAVHALSAAVERLVAALLTAGWRSLPPGEAWYERRFAWLPQGAHDRGRPSKRFPRRARRTRARDARRRSEAG